MTTSLVPGMDRSLPPDKEIQDQEKSLMETMKVGLDYWAFMVYKHENM